ncbi:haloalkane dehalogenase [Streptomyces sp. NPDC050732]|uniref:haloalkane dehalogenase n=1 Tax=Streptomyces sp. NPDC050732 TaxID=3154632 RepID=UPI00343368B2
MPEIAVLDSTMYYQDHGPEDRGRGEPVVVFLHGNPTSSYLWRSVIPQVSSRWRCLAPDLIGMGRSGKPDIGYRFTDHARYLDAWFDTLGLDRVVLVVHDWGGALGFDWAARHPGRVTAAVFMETVIRPFTWDDFPDHARTVFGTARTPGAGEEMFLDQSAFIEQMLPALTLRTFTAEELDTYRAPYREREHRLPTLMWARELPIEGEPADVTARVEQFDTWLADSTDVPKLLLTFDPGLIMAPQMIDWCRHNVTALDIQHIGPGVHFVQEDQGPAIGAAITTWLAGQTPHLRPRP